jgi:branched-subunit amino acid transport protein
VFWELGKTNNFLMSLFPTIITKEILGRNVALTNFVGMIATVIARS